LRRRSRAGGKADARRSKRNPFNVSPNRGWKARRCPPSTWRRILHATFPSRRHPRAHDKERNAGKQTGRTRRPAAGQHRAAWISFLRPR
jgi:hypothetical protein